MVVFFTGAGISAESGISTFRDKDGLWENNKIEEICNFNTWKQNKEKVFQFYNERRQQLKDVEPNSIHHTLAKLQHTYGCDNVKIITQNVDDLLERGGCQEVLHVHGELSKIQCVECQHTFDIGYNGIESNTPCPQCQSMSLKPFIVFFNEMAPNYYFMKKILNNLDENDMMIVMGTNGNVVPIHYYAQTMFGIKVLNNLELSKYIDDKNFNYVFYEKGSIAIPKIEVIVDTYFKKR